MSLEPLVYIPVNRWSELKAVLKSDWPRSILGFLALEKEEYLLKSGLQYGFKIYCAYGDVNNGMVAVNILNKYHEIIIQCPQDDTRKLEEALRTTKIIDWRKCNQIPASDEHVRNCVYRIFAENHIKIDPDLNITSADAFVLDRNAPLYDVKIPPGFSFDFLTLDSIPKVNETWPNKYPGSEWYFDFLIKASLAYGLYHGKDLVSWVVLKEIGPLGHLYTLEKHRRKGYGELVLKLISNIQLKDNKYTVAYCASYSTSAAKLYNKLGFSNLARVDWIYRL